MEELKTLKNLKNVVSIDNVALKGSLSCDCGNESFYVYHSGKVTKGILAPYIIKKNNQLIVVAKCCCCGNVITIFDNNAATKIEKEKFIIPDLDDKFQVTLMYNYYPNNFKTNMYEELFVEIKNKDMKKAKILIEV